MPLSRAAKILVFLCLVTASGAAQAQLAPTPQKAPRTPVRQQQLAIAKQPPLPASRTLTGEAVILDPERLRIDRIEMRLFGVVPPLLSAAFGPQARAALDQLAKEPVTCRLRDRDRDGRLFASCQNESGLDFGVELLRRGLAVTARGSLHGTELALTYVAAEEAAKSQRLGLWSVRAPEAASKSSIEMAAQKAVSPAAPAVGETPAQPEAAPQETKTAAPEQPSPAPPETAVAVSSADKPATTAGESLLFVQDEAGAAPELVLPETGFVERYQLLLTGLSFLLAALIGASGFAWVRRQEKRDSLRAIAAALRGEIMAMRSVCLARLSKMEKDGDEKTTSWPRLRSTIFQAYVGELGRLGADLARQIASIYGQSSDYASYYVGAGARPEAASKKQALQTLVHHIEDVVPRLAGIERDGFAPRPPSASLAPSLLARVARQGDAIKSLLKPSLLPHGWPGRPAPLPPPKAAEAPQERPSAKEKAEESRPPESPETKEEPVAEKTAEESPKEAPPPTDQPTIKQARPGKKAAPASKRAAKTEKTRQPPQKRYASLNPEKIAEVTARLGRMKDFLAGQWDRLKPETKDFYKDLLPEYAHLTEEELEALAYFEENPYREEEEEAPRKTG